MAPGVRRRRRATTTCTSADPRTRTAARARSGTGTGARSGTCSSTRTRTRAGCNHHDAATRTSPRQTRPRSTAGRNHRQPERSSCGCRLHRGCRHLRSHRSCGRRGSQSRWAERAPRRHGPIPFRPCPAESLGAVWRRRPVSAIRPRRKGASVPHAAARSGRAGLRRGYAFVRAGIGGRNTHWRDCPPSHCGAAMIRAPAGHKGF